MNTPVRTLCLCLVSSLAACGTVHRWQELRSDPMTFGECYDGLAYVAQTGGFVADTSVSDRGLGILQSRWRQRMLANTHPARYRLRAEVLIDEGTAATGWPVRFVIEQEHVKDLRRSLDPKEEDWSRVGQDGEGEALLGDRLVRRLAPRSMPAPPRRPEIRPLP